jgi:hypothetical protein
MGSPCGLATTRCASVRVSHVRGPWHAPHPSLEDPAGRTLPPSTAPSLSRRAQRRATERAEPPRSRREPSRPVGLRPRGGAATEARTASTRPCPQRARRHAPATRWGTAAPPLSRHARPAPRLFARSPAFPAGSLRPGPREHPLNVSECHKRHLHSCDLLLDPPSVNSMKRDRSRLPVLLHLLLLRRRSPRPSSRWLGCWS